MSNANKREQHTRDLKNNANQKKREAIAAKDKAQKKNDKLLRLNDELMTKLQQQVRRHRKTIRTSVLITTYMLCLLFI